MLKKARSRQYYADTITDSDYTDNITVLANTPAKAESLLHSVKQPAGGIANKQSVYVLNEKEQSPL